MYVHKNSTLLNFYISRLAFGITNHGPTSSTQKNLMRTQLCFINNKFNDIMILGSGWIILMRLAEALHNPCKREPTSYHLSQLSYRPLETLLNVYIVM